MNKILPEKETFSELMVFFIFNAFVYFYAYGSHINLAQKGDQPLSSEEAAQNRQYL